MQEDHDDTFNGKDDQSTQTKTKNGDTRQCNMGKDIINDQMARGDMCRKSRCERKRNTRLDGFVMPSDRSYIRKSKRERKGLLEKS